MNRFTQSVQWTNTSFWEKSNPNSGKRLGRVRIIYLLTPWIRVLLEKLTGSAASQEIPLIFGTRRFLTVLKPAATCPYPEPTPSSPHNPSHFLKIHLNIILPSTSGSPQWSLSLRSVLIVCIISLVSTVSIVSIIIIIVSLSALSALSASSTSTV